MARSRWHWPASFLHVEILSESAGQRWPWILTVGVSLGVCLVIVVVKNSVDPGAPSMNSSGSMVLGRGLSFLGLVGLCGGAVATIWRGFGADGRWVPRGPRWALLPLVGVALFCLGAWLI